MRQHGFTIPVAKCKVRSQHRSKQQVGFTQPPGNQEDGFTIIELMIATLVFSVILLILSAGLIQITRLYYKGITTSRTQQTARSITDTISRDIQFNGGTVTPIPPVKDSITNLWYFCVAGTRYTYQLNKQLVDGTPDVSKDQASHVFVRDNPAGCTGSADFTALAPGATELMATNMRLSKFSLTSGSSNLFSMALRVVSGDNDLLCSPKAGDCNSSIDSIHLSNDDINCKSISGAQFCAASELQSTVQKRI